MTELKNLQLYFCQGVYWWISPAKLSNHAISLFLWLFTPEPEWENQQARQWFFFPLSFYETRYISSILQRYTFFNHSGEFWKHGKLLNYGTSYTSCRLNLHDQLSRLCVYGIHKRPLRAPTKENALALITVDIGGKNPQG